MIRCDLQEVQSMGCAAMMIHVLCFSCYYGERHWTTTLGSCGWAITEGTRQYHRGMAGCVA